MWSVRSMGKFGQSGHEKDRVKAGQSGTRQDSQEHGRTQSGKSGKSGN